MAKRGRPKGSFRPHPAGERDYAMKRLSDEGNTLQQIGDSFGITRERVRQLLTKYFGITKENCARRKIIEVRVFEETFQKIERVKNNREYRFAKVYGCSPDTAAQINGGDVGFSTNSRGPARAYYWQRRNAKTRNIEWKITFPEWWRVWQESGKWSLRGRGHGYAMARYGDSGPYEIGNVYICTGAQNTSDQYLVRSLNKQISLMREGSKRYWEEKRRVAVNA